MKQNNQKILKRSVIVIPGLSFGGAERVTSFLSNYFVEHGREVHIISLSKGNHAYPLSSSVILHEIDISQKKNKIGRYIYLILRTRKLIKEIQPTSILAMISYAASLTAVAALGLNIPLIVSERNDPNTSKTFSNSAKKVFYFVHRYLATKAVYQTSSAQSYYFSKPNDKAVIIPNPLYLEDMPKPNKGLVKSGKIITAGRLTKQKNHRVLIEAFADIHKRYPNYTLWIYGEGEEAEDLRQSISDHMLEDSVFLPGNISDLFVRMQEAELFVMSSDYEGMPNALIEAMAMGLPCITTDYSEGRGTVIEHEKNGLVVERNNREALSSALLKLIENEAMTRDLASNAVRIREVLNSINICSKWLQTIEETEDSYS
jgi:glycosyltransferase involved in cell wall biosynthesis